MKKTIINLAIVSCFTLAATLVYADSDTSMSDRSGDSGQSRSGMSVPSDTSGSDKSKASAGISEEDRSDAPKDSDH